MSDELLPCPFCGYSAPDFHHGPYTYVKCDSCGCDGPWNDDDDYERAAALWNQRAEPAKAES